MTGDLNTRLSRLSKEQRADLLARLRAGSGADQARLVPRARTRLMTPSFQQEQMWFVDRLASGRARNNSNQGLRMRGPLDVDALRAALRVIVERHEILRTTLTEQDGQVWQVIHPSMDIDLPVADLSCGPAAQRAERVDAARREHTRHGFDLATGPLARALLIRLGDQEHLFLWAAHHIIWDPGSRQVFFTELGELYSAAVAGRPARLADLPVQYADFAAWQRERVADPHGGGLRTFWAQRLRGLDGLEVLPDLPRPRLQGFAGTRIHRPAAGGVLARLDELSKRHHCTLFMTLLAALDALLFRLTGEADVSVATASVMRRRDELRPLLGCFVNMVVLRADVSGDPTFAELLDRVRGTVLEAFSNEELPFEKVVEAVNPWRDPSRNPLFQIEFTATPGSGVPTVSMAGLDVTAIPIPDEVSRFDMSVLATGGDELRLGIEFNTDLYLPDTIERMLERLELLLCDAIARPGTRVSDLRIATERELAALTGSWSHGPPACDGDDTLDRMFGRQAAATPDSVAVVCGTQRLTYAELDRRAGRLACQLRRLGVGPDQCVGVCVSRSADAIVAVLGVLKAGGGYVPVDPGFPADRLRRLLADAQAQVLVADSAAVQGRPVARTVLLDRDLLPQAAGPEPQASGPEPTAAPGNLAYVIYTSGSTGQPKGVMVEHRSVAHFVRAIVAAYELAPGDRIVQFASLAFDVSVFDIFAALLSGATLVVASEEERHDPWQLTALLAGQRITVAELPPALVPSLDAAAFGDLRLLSLGGEAVPMAVVRQWSAPGRRIVNGYGPTETTVAVTLMDCAASPAASPPIGRPIAGHQALVLDGADRPVPVGVPGELCIAGPGVARGYLGQPAATAARFVPCPYPRTPGERMYRTGDLVRWLPGGNLEFLGRRDRQVKVRGFRVEPQEIESALLSHPDVRGAAVQPIRRGDQHELVAYAETGVTQAALRDFLAGRLAAYLIPAQIIAVGTIPRTPAGKVDRDALPRPDAHRGSASGAARAPADELERRLASEVFADLLGVEAVGADEDFFELGGNSLHATRLLARVASAFGVRLALADFFTKPTVAGVADLVRLHQGQDRPANGLARLLDGIEALGDDEAAGMLGLLEEIA